MILQKYAYLKFVALCFAIVSIISCEFNDPYVPEEAGSSSLTGRIVTDPPIDPSGADVLLRGRVSFAGIIDANGAFHFQDIPPGDYSLHVQKKPYLQEKIDLQEKLPEGVRKSVHEDIGEVNVKLKGAISGTIPNDKIAIIHGEVEISVYVDGVPIETQPDGGEFAISLSSTESSVSIHAEPKIAVYIDNIPYYATVKDKGTFVVEFIPPGVYNDVRVKLDSAENSFPIASGGPIVVKSGETHFLTHLP